MGPVLKDINAGKLSDRGVFKNKGNPLPGQPQGYYKEYEVPNTPNFNKPSAGPERIIQGQNGETYYTSDHYATFTQLNN